MILRRLGNKAKIAREIQKYFPPHKIYIEPFFGAGGIFFNKPKANHNLLNDIDDEVYNLFQVVMHQKDELKNAFHKMPLHMSLFGYWRQHQEVNPILKALRFILLSNYGYMGMPESFRLTGTKTEYADTFNAKLDMTYEQLFNCQFANMDFRKFIPSISFKNDGRNDEEKAFIYCDPPYLGTNDNYSYSFTEQDSIELFDCLQGSGVKWAMSEFDNPSILAQAKERGLFVAKISERQNLKNRRLEILITNYKPQITLFD